MKLASGRGNNWRLKEEIFGLEVGTYVCPIEYHHLPDHIKRELSPYFDHKLEVVCYTPKGMKNIPRNCLEQA